MRIINLKKRKDDVKELGIEAASRVTAGIQARKLTWTVETESAVHVEERVR